MKLKSNFIKIKEENITLIFSTDEMLEYQNSSKEQIILFINNENVVKASNLKKNNLIIVNIDDYLNKIKEKKIYQINEFDRMMIIFSSFNIEYIKNYLEENKCIDLINILRHKS